MGDLDWKEREIGRMRKMAREKERVRGRGTAQERKRRREGD